MGSEMCIRDSPNITIGELVVRAEEDGIIEKGAGFKALIACSPPFQAELLNVFYRAQKKDKFGSNGIITIGGQSKVYKNPRDYLAALIAVAPKYNRQVGKHLSDLADIRCGKTFITPDAVKRTISSD